MALNIFYKFIRINLDLILIILFALLTNLLIISNTVVNTTRVVISIPFIFFTSGYALLGFLFSEKSEIDILERIILSMGVSIAIIISTGFLLNYSSVGISVNSIMFYVSVITIFLCFVSVIKRYMNNKLSYVS